MNIKNKIGLKIGKFLPTYVITSNARKLDSNILLYNIEEIDINDKKFPSMLLDLK